MSMITPPLPLAPSRAMSAALSHFSALQNALFDSRQRWRDLVMVAADLAFETDESGRFAFVAPDPALGWSSASLIGESSDLLLADGAGTAVNPFRPAELLRRRRVWIRRQDGRTACMIFAAAPLLDRNGIVIGARGFGLDLTEQDGHDAMVAAALRRAELIEHILSCMRQEVMAPRMMEAALGALRQAVAAEGAAVIDVAGDGDGPVVLHLSGCGEAEALPGALASLTSLGPEAMRSAVASMAGPDHGRPVLACPCHTRFGEQVGLVLWRALGAATWNGDDQRLATAAVSIIRMVLEHEAIQREMGRQARTDPLTGLMNRRAFMEELGRHIDRLDREGLPGTLVFLDLDNFKPLNDSLGHEVGDKALCQLAGLLRVVVRPTDLVARLGGDEFALWLNGADHFTAAERAEALRQRGAEAFSAIANAGSPALTLSVGIATRRPGGSEEIDDLMRRADCAMYEVKRGGRNHWLVSPDPAEAAV